ncbi:MAG: hypothetical protein CUN55_00245 [Phototrophicales bacterium]|nr:MAG: hypothetical protein CUN55_00245 [Phototrophicales bacterium]
MSDPQLDRVRELIAEDQIDAAEEVLASVAHPMTQIWLDHLRRGGRERLLLQESLALHADDPRIAEAQACIERDDLEGATQILSAINHPMTQVWLEHLRRGGRQRLLAREEAPAPPASARSSPEAQPMIEPAMPVPANPNVYAAAPVLTLTPPTRHGWRALRDYWARLLPIEQVIVGGGIAFLLFLSFTLMMPLGQIIFWPMVIGLVLLRFMRVHVQIHTLSEGGLLWVEEARLFGKTLWQYRLLHPRPIQYVGAHVPHLRIPPSVLALNIQPDEEYGGGSAEAVRAFIIIQLTLLTLWATGRILLCIQRPQWRFLGFTVSLPKRYILRPSSTMQASDGVEELIWAHIAITPTVGQRILTFAKLLLSNPRHVVQLAESEALQLGVAKRSLLRRRLQFDESYWFKQELLQLTNLQMDVQEYHPQVYKLISSALAKVAHVYPLHSEEKQGGFLDFSKWDW